MSIQAVSGLTPGAAAVPAAKEAPKIQRQEEPAPAPARAPRPNRDEYIPENKRGPEKPAAPEKNSGGRKAERCVGSTDAVDREIQALKRKREELVRQISTETDEGKRKGLEQKLAQVERELAQKDNDAYRRQHTVFS